MARMKNQDSGNPVDFHNLSTDQVDKLKRCITAVAEYKAEAREVSRSSSETIMNLVTDLDADKASAKTIKSVVNKAARALANKNVAEKLLEENGAIEMMLNKMGIITI